MHGSKPSNPMPSVSLTTRLYQFLCILISQLEEDSGLQTRLIVKKVGRHL